MHSTEVTVGAVGVDFPERACDASWVVAQGLVCVEVEATITRPERVELVTSNTFSFVFEVRGSLSNLRSVCLVLAVCLCKKSSCRIPGAGPEVIAAP
jgi:hypothetical protein